MPTREAAPPFGRIDLAAWALFVTQLVHGFTPADTSSEGYVGTVVGGVLLIASAVAIFALRLGASWAPRLVGVTGLAVAAGFVAYHATPVRSPITNPYVGEPVGWPAWVSVALAVAAGLVSCAVGLGPALRSRTARPSP
jgi:hypothetical protein